MPTRLSPIDGGNNDSVLADHYVKWAFHFLVGAENGTSTYGLPLRLYGATGVRCAMMMVTTKTTTTMMAMMLTMTAAAAVAAAAAAAAAAALSTIASSKDRTVASVPSMRVLMRVNLSAKHAGRNTCRYSFVYSNWTTNDPRATDTKLFEIPKHCLLSSKACRAMRHGGVD